MSGSLPDALAEFTGAVPLREVDLPFGSTRVWDLGDGPPIVLLHGIAASRRVFFRVAPRLAERHRVVVPLLRGEERADGRMTHDQLLDDVAALLDGLDLDDVTLVGVSFGGTIALGYGARHDPRIARVAVQGTFTRFRLRPADRAVLFASRFVPASWAARYFSWRVTRGPETEVLREHAPGIETLLPDWSGKTPFRSLARRTRVIGGIDLREAVRSLRVPLTVAHGGRDRVVPRACFDELCRLRPDARHLFWPETGHNVALSHPERFDQLVARSRGE